jgi:hypothetical protein
MTKELIKKSIEYLLEKAWENPNEAKYYLEQLPYAKDSDYDETVHDFISKLEYQIKKEEREDYDYAVEDLVEHYFVNQEDYEF